MMPVHRSRKLLCTNEAFNTKKIVKISIKSTLSGATLGCLLIEQHNEQRRVIVTAFNLSVAFCRLNSAVWSYQNAGEHWFLKSSEENQQRRRRETEKRGSEFKSNLTTATNTQPTTNFRLLVWTQNGRRHLNLDHHRRRCRRHLRCRRHRHVV